jgi:hypothetical protein
MAGMTVNFHMIRDSANSYLEFGKGVEFTECDDVIAIALKNPEREVYINKKDFLKYCQMLVLSEPEVEEKPDHRDPACVKNWPQCVNDGYNPACCRFPKSCSCGG